MIGRHKKIFSVVYMLLLISMLLFIGIGCTQFNVREDESNDSGKTGLQDNTSEKSSSGQSADKQGDKQEDKQGGKHENEQQNEQDNKQENEQKDKSGGKPSITVTVVEGGDYVSIDKPVKNFELMDLQGNQVKLSDYSGKMVFLNYWATWCPPCRAEMPDMQEIYEQYKDQGIEILAVSSTNLELRGGTDSEKARKNVEEFIDESGYTFPVLLDSDNKVMSDWYQLYPITGIPTTFMIDRDGIVRYARVGAFTGKGQMEEFIMLLEK